MEIESGYNLLVMIVSGITLLLLLGVFVWENYGSVEWGTWIKPVSLWEVFRDWTAYVLIFVMLLIVLRGLLCLLCSQCQSC